MTVMKPVLELVIDANIVLVLAFCLWWVAQALIVRTRLRTDYALQLRLLRATLLLVLASPALSYLAVSVSQFVWPMAPITVSDLAVAAYLRGEISIPAQQFEALLSARSHFLDRVLSGAWPTMSAFLVAVAAGACFIFLRSLSAALKVRRVVANSHVWRRSASTDIRLSDAATIPFVTRGLFRRHVVIPSRLITSPKDMRIVLAHEFQHIRLGDAEWELALEFLRPLLYINPAFLLWKMSFDRLRELNCDQAVLQKLTVTPREYATCLLDICERSSLRQAATVFNVAFIRTGPQSAKAALAERVLALCDRPASRNPWAFRLSVAALAVGILLAAASVRTPGDWSHDRLMLSTIVNLERMEIRGF